MAKIIFLQLIDLNILTIDFRDISNFLLGMLTGFILLGLLITFIVSTSSRRKQRKRMLALPEIKEKKEVYDLIELKQNEMIETVKLTDNAYFGVALTLSLELAEEIASYYYPKAKYPMYELSIEEILELNYYITKRVEKLVNGKILKHFKKYKISTIIDILNKKKAIDNSKLMKLSKKLKVSKIISLGKTVLNYASPVFWFRKLAIKPGTELVTKEVCKFIIAIVGEETNYVYSRSLFKHNDEEEQKAEETFNDMLENEGEE
ncbi:hypothetical protein [Aliarcobacter skirrowii]|jgi:hypothetical protein|uniref:hypothetical protein n=1 Tax=Aliarcobacter skirrowii TaxID=28200 RepID=UPI0025822784|nr:hypothetical protein [Aliarcobacter skirrowii]MDD3129900.1 hypothetical protein [Candidatus Izemoplasmatales bacterium]MDD4069911.1 hypothetical protein [Candidatus Izemoplasmatales bacterium]MDY0181667.1 hypothetical protein [Aliarcobacter skirrowii]